VVKFNQRHPEKDVAIIDYNMATVMLPMVMAGSLIGVFLNNLLPSLIILIVLTLILVFILVYTIYKAIKLFKFET